MTRSNGLRALALAAGVFASSLALAQQLTLDVFYANPGFQKFHDAIAEEYMRRTPNVKIQFRAPAANTFGIEV